MNKIINNKKLNGSLGIIILGIFFVFCFVISFFLGKYSVSPEELMRILFSKIIPIDKTWTMQAENIVFNIRLPRVLSGAIIGAGLSCAGAAYQGLFRNPMVSPDILGASEGASFGAALGLLLSFRLITVSLMAFAFGMGAVLLAYLISVKARANKTLSMVLCGIMIGSIFSSATSLIKLVADPTSSLPAITYWLMGSLASIKLNELAISSIPILFGMILLFSIRWRINIMTMGDEEAVTLGVNVKLIRIVIVFSATLITASCVAVSGMIGWIGLVIPHFSRMIFGSDYRITLPASMLLGASYLVIVDDFARTIAPSEIPIGILTAFIGAPFFVYLILNKGGR